VIISEFRDFFKFNFQTRPNKYSRTYRKYSPDVLLKAYEEVKTKGVSVRKVANQFNVPVQTLRDRVKGHIDPLNFVKGGDTIFTHEEESSLVDHLEAMAGLGYGATNTKLQELGGELAYALGKRDSSKQLSNCWLYGFLKRWEARVRSIRPQSLEVNRAKSSTPDIISKYFCNLEKVIQENNLADKPQYIYNVDETGIQPEHRPPNIIAPVKSKPQAITSPRTTTTTVIACGNALGNYIPPYFVFKGKRFNPDFMKGASPGSQAVMSDSGWSNSSIFRGYLETHFLPHVRRGCNDKQPVLLIFDGHTSHISRELIEWANSQHIVMFVLPAHTSHILQPLDTAVFGPFKNFYYRECAAFMSTNMGKTVTKYEMAELASRAYLKAMTPSNLVSAFKKTGIFPFCREAVPKEKLFPCESFQDDNPVQKVKALRSGKEAVEEYLKQKMEKQPEIQCACKCKPKENITTTKRTKPKPSGRDITNPSFIDELTIYEKENRAPQAKSPTNTPKPSTSGIIPRKVHMAETVDDDDDYDDDTTDDSSLCCICKKFSPPNLNDRPYLKIVSWAQCVKCNHWCHLSFCHRQSVVRRGEDFFCPHCE
jgi:hypothetical protein